MQAQRVPPTASRILLVLSLVLGVIGIGGAASGAADKDSGKQASTPTTRLRDTTTTELPTTTTVPATTTTVKGKPVATTAKPKATTTTVALGGECVGAPTSTNPGAEQPPAIGTFTYVSCSDASQTTELKVAAGANTAGVVRRQVTTAQGQLGTATATAAYGTAGIIQEKLTIQAQGVSLQCDWIPDIVEYPAALAVGTAWNADSKCTAQTAYGAITIHAVAARKVTGRVATKIAGTSVNTWVIDSTLTLTFSGGPVTRPVNGSVNETSTTFFDPTRGIEVYDKSTSEGKGDFAFPSQTNERRLKSLTPTS